MEKEEKEEARKYLMEKRAELRVMLLKIEAALMALDTDGKNIIIPAGKR